MFHVEQKLIDAGFTQMGADVDADDRRSLVRNVYTIA